jgi:asparagine synthase (glutamine-hydrolysing)
MPGLAGFVCSRKDALKSDAIDRMVECLRHEQFYKTGTYVNPAFGVALGWMAHPGGFSEEMPLWNETRDVCIVFTGEDFTDQSEIEALRAEGHVFDPHNGNYLPHLYEKEGLKFLERLNGCFSGVLIDLREGRVVLFNDRYGLSRIYYHETADGFYFASEAKALLKILPNLRQLDMQGLAEAFSVGCALENRTLFSGVSLLPGASKWSLSTRGPVKKETYFDKATWESQDPLPASEYYDRLTSTFGRILPRYFQGKQSIGLSLTGGLDSRMIIAATLTGTRIPCYTFGGMYRECADVRLARQIASICGQTHTVIPVAREFFPEFPELARRSVYYSDGSMDVLGSVELYVNRTARQIAPVRLTGNYGSEILRTNVAFKPMPLNSAMFESDFSSFVEQAAGTYQRERIGSKTSFIAFKQVPWHHYSRMAVEQSQLTPRSPFLDNDLVSLAYQAPAELRINKALAHQCIAERNPALANVPTDRGCLGGDGFLSSKVGVFCQELLPRMEYMFDYGMPAWLAKWDRVLSPLKVDRLFLGRQKFYHFRRWYRDELAPYVKDMLLSKRTLDRPYLNSQQVVKMVKAHTAGQANYTLEIHKLLTSELIQRELIERN